MLNFCTGSRLMSRALRFQPAVLPAASRRLVSQFSDFPLHPTLLARIPHPSCTEVQEKTLPLLLDGVDVLAQAKTGTGKTAAFLIPTLDNLIRGPPRSRGSISTLIISPTRELANQIAKEAETLAPAGTKIVTVFGATNVNKDLRNLESGADILVGTPGRLNDLIANYGLREKLTGVRFVILDEGDTLLDQGFKVPILKILDSLPSRRIHPRQTLLFSATIPASLKAVVSQALLPSYKHLSCLKAGEENTHVHVPQDATVVSISDIYAAGLARIQEEIVRNEKSGDKHKIIVFLPTARGTSVLFEAGKQFNLGEKTLQIQSRMSQKARERSIAEFKACKTGVLFSSDVTARGIDVQDVTMVLQIGVPMNPEQYIHRLGRTARAGKQGRGSLVLTSAEESFLEKGPMKALSLKRVETPSNLAAMKEVLARAFGNVDEKIKQSAAIAHMGYYNGSIKDKSYLVEFTKKYAVDTLGLAKMSGIEKSTVSKMGLKGVPGIEIIPSTPRPAGSARR